jgi:molybdopterin-binding protein
VWTGYVLPIIINPLKGGDMFKVSARNVLKGRVKKVTQGAVNTEVILELPGGIEIVSIITKESAESMKIAEGKEAIALIKASSVMLAVE